MLDLHLHTLASDGAHSPEELLKLVQEKGLSAFGIADHNSIASLKSAFSLAKENKISFFPAVEIDTLYKDKDLHLLAYGVNFQNPDWQEWMKQISQAKNLQTQRRVQKLKELGFKIEYQELVKISQGKMPSGGDYVKALSLSPEGKNDPRVRNYIDGPRSDSPYLNFYLDWLKAGRPAFVPFEEMNCEKVIKKILELNAAPVLAHPSDTPEQYVRELKKLGLMGIEVYTSYHSRELARLWIKLAKELELLITAGSDFHGKPVKPEVEMGINCKEEKEIIERLSLAISAKRGIYLK